MHHDQLESLLMRVCLLFVCRIEASEEEAGIEGASDEEDSPGSSRRGWIEEVFCDARIQQDHNIPIEDHAGEEVGASVEGRIQESEGAGAREGWSDRWTAKGGGEQRTATSALISPSMLLFCVVPGKPKKPKKEKDPNEPKVSANGPAQSARVLADSAPSLTCRLRVLCVLSASSFCVFHLPR